MFHAYLCNLYALRAASQGKLRIGNLSHLLKRVSYCIFPQLATLKNDYFCTAKPAMNTLNLSFQHTPVPSRCSTELWSLPFWPLQLWPLQHFLLNWYDLHIVPNYLVCASNKNELVSLRRSEISNRKCFIDKFSQFGPDSLAVMFTFSFMVHSSQCAGLSVR